jgi:hypothetical protein
VTGVICARCGYHRDECVCPDPDFYDPECPGCGADDGTCWCFDEFEDDDWRPAPRSTVTLDVRGGVL